MARASLRDWHEPIRRVGPRLEVARKNERISFRLTGTSFRACDKNGGAVLTYACFFVAFQLNESTPATLPSAPLRRRAQMVLPPWAGAEQPS